MACRTIRELAVSNENVFLKVRLRGRQLTLYTKQVYFALVSFVGV